MSLVAASVVVVAGALLVGLAVLSVVVALQLRTRKRVSEPVVFLPEMEARGTWWGLGATEYVYRGLAGRVFSTGQGQVPWLPEDAPEVLVAFQRTLFQQNLPAWQPGRLVVLRDITLPGFQARNLQDIKLGDPEFDDLFLVEESTPGMAAGLLKHSVRRSLVELRKASALPLGLRPPEIGLMMAGETLYLAVAETREKAILALMREVVTGIVDAVCGSPRPLLAPPGSGAVEPRCLVCGVALAEEPTASCPKCGTLHHGVCFRYLGRCAVFACDGRSEPDSPPSPAR